MPAFGQYLEFIIDEVAMGQEFLTKLRFSSVSILISILHIHILLIFHQSYIILAFYNIENVKLHTLILSLFYAYASKMIS